MQVKPLIVAAVSSLFAYGAAQAQTVIAPADGADTILIVTPADSTTTVLRDESLPATRDQIRAEARDATRNGGTPRGEQNYSDQGRHMQSADDPHRAAGDENGSR